MLWFPLCCQFLKLPVLHGNPVRITAKKQGNPCVVLSCVVTTEKNPIWTTQFCCLKRISANTLHIGCSSNYTSFSWIAEWNVVFTGFVFLQCKQIKYLHHKCYCFSDVFTLEVTENDDKDISFFKTLFIIAKWKQIKLWPHQINEQFLT